MSGPLLFGTDGVRGIAGKAPLTRALIRDLGAAAAAVFRSQEPNSSPVFLMGRDTRGSGAWIAQAFAQGARSQHVVTKMAGVISTPSLAYLVPHRKVLGGVMISASHNPAAFNGIKLFGPDGRKCPDAWERAIEKKTVDLNSSKTRGVLHLHLDRKALADYHAFLYSTLPKNFSLKGMRLVVDCAHGSLSSIAPLLFKKLGAKVFTVGCKPNGRNINEGCGSQHPEMMQQLVLEKGAHGGIAFDGDGDRAIFCDETGRLLDGDYLIAYSAHSLLHQKRLPGHYVVLTIMANLGLVQALKSWGVQCSMTSVGDRYVSEEMQEKRSVLGGEQSGHIIFREFLPTGDGLLTALQVLSFLKGNEHPFSFIYSLFERYPQVLLNVPVQKKRPLEDCPELQEHIQKARAQLGELGRVLVRYSGTEPLLRIMLEGPNKQTLQKLSEDIATQARRNLGKV